MATAGQARPATAAAYGAGFGTLFLHEKDVSQRPAQLFFVGYSFD